MPGTAGDGGLTVTRGARLWFPGGAKGAKLDAAPEHAVAPFAVVPTARDRVSPWLSAEGRGTGSGGATRRHCGQEGALPLGLQS